MSIIPKSRIKESELGQTNYLAQKLFIIVDLFQSGGEA